ncbi:MAG: hypothetical protein UZ07_CHB004003188 [Chlorobi bacterium OLB7]|nr:MAG: hypothetical protein UZ07_CHB004003188 [Chlorobi bacterium OLB7]
MRKMEVAHSRNTSETSVTSVRLTDIRNITITMPRMVKMFATIITNPLLKKSFNTSTSLVTRVTNRPIGLVS